MTDCLIIGSNMVPIQEHADTVQSLDGNGGAWRDLRLAFVEHQGRRYTPLDLMNLFHDEAASGEATFHNLDFLWPTVTYLCSFLHRRGFKVDWINLFQQELDSLKQKLSSGQVRSVAITSTLYVSPQPLIEIIRFVRSHSNAHIIVGGPYIAGQADLLTDDEFNNLLLYLGANTYVISSEGEQALAKVLTALRAGESFHNIANLAFVTQQGSQAAVTKTAIEIESNPLEKETINYQLFPKQSIGQFISLRTAKSCPYACAFCGFPKRAGRYKTLAPELVEKELDALAQIGGITTLTFLDDTFNVPKKRFKEILQMMIRRDYGFRWNSFYRSDQGDHETIELMREAGCEGVFLGIESGSDIMLKKMEKTARRQHFVDAIPKLQSLGISVHASLIVGFPGETDTTLRETQALIEETQPDYFRAQLWYCDPLTPIWEKRHEVGIQGSGFSWRHHTMDSEIASDWVDRLFFTTKNSTWLPQHGFEQWSLFYLQRRGFSHQQIIDYVTLFNAVVKSQMSDKTLKSIPTPLLKDLRKIALGGNADSTLLSAFRNTGPVMVEQDAEESFAF